MAVFGPDGRLLVTLLSNWYQWYGIVDVHRCLNIWGASMNIGAPRSGRLSSFRLYAAKDQNGGDQIKARVHGNVRPDISSTFIHIT